MWRYGIDDAAAFATTHRLPLNMVREFLCTGEHLVARHDGGNDSCNNVVAACAYCNRRRHHHRPSRAPSPTAYRRRVQELMSKGRWLGAVLFRTGSLGEAAASPV